MISNDDLDIAIRNTLYIHVKHDQNNIEKI